MSENKSFGSVLQSGSCGLKFEKSAFGNTRTLEDSQMRRIADEFGSEADSISARKSLINRKHPAVKAVNAVMTAARKVWVSCTLPYPDTGIRLIKRSKVDWFIEQMGECRTLLSLAVAEMDAARDDLVEEARGRLADLFDATQYPASFADDYSIDWSFPSLNPPEWMKELNPAAYEAEVAKVKAQFEIAVVQAEEAFKSQFVKIVEDLKCKLAGKAEVGKLRSDSFKTLQKFVESYKELNIGSSAELDAMVLEAEKLIDPAAKGSDVIAKMASQFGEIHANLDSMIVKSGSRKLNLSDDDESDDDAVYEDVAA